MVTIREVLSPEKVRVLEALAGEPLRRAARVIADFGPFRREVLRGPSNPARFALARRALRRADLRVPRELFARVVREAEKLVN